jgi:hypothetical protein
MPPLFSCRYFKKSDEFEWGLIEIPIQTRGKKKVDPQETCMKIAGLGGDGERVGPVPTSDVVAPHVIKKIT